MRWTLAEINPCKVTDGKTKNKQQRVREIP